MSFGNDDQQRERNDAVLKALGGVPQPPSASSQTLPQQPMQQAGWYPADQGYQVPNVPNVPNVLVTEEGQSSTPMAYWVLPDLIIGFLIAVILQVIIMVGYMLAKGFSSIDDIQGLLTDPTFMLLNAPTLGLGFTMASILRVNLLRKLPLAWFGLNGKKLGLALGLGFVAGISFLVTNFISGLIGTALGSNPDQQDQLIGPFRDASNLQIGLFGLFVVIIGPFLEEVFFRGYAFRALRQKLGVTWGVVLSAVMFALPHVFGVTTGYIALLIPIFLGGVILAIVYHYTNNLWSAVLAHAMNNFVGFLGLLAALKLDI
ncbi:CPBP family intramembrane glutamic endopeptidase [Herpetosiphon llansteffanensis]|uniref:CPBP family intramembrane glutamic endopeptidase n=1 Tax=Herpetosiphon llansteffanensis TaxID=2094568 RepID=UPI0013E08908|nr:type II CAAX endopeptidase family protein [Herpetosiphon llansteffanensis]